MGARFNPTHRCGHMGRAMPDTATARAFAAEAIEPTDCWDCTRMAHGLVAAEMMERLGLPPLSILTDRDGRITEPSERQQTFARDIRERIRQELEDAGSADTPAADALLYGVTDARFWLDRKERPAAELIAWIKPVVDVALSARS